MRSLDAVGSHLAVVLVVDPVAPSRHLMWRLLSQSFGVIEAVDARAARDWLACRPDIDALVVQNDLPDGRGSDLVRSLAKSRVAAASQAVVVARPVDLRAVAMSLASWFFGHDARKAETLLGDAERLSSHRQGARAGVGA
jgi:DNA-binding NtrC family response regulator